MKNDETARSVKADHIRAYSNIVEDDRHKFRPEK